MFPRKVQVGAVSYTVVRTNDPDDIREAYAETRLRSQRFTLHPRNGPDVDADSLLHEVLHAIWAQTPLPAAEALDNQEEAIVRAFAPMLLDTLRRNPKLVAFLVGR